jgi:hypothetical protein
MSKDAAAQAGQAANTAAAIQAGGEVLSLAVNTIATISDANQKRKFSQNLDALSLEQQDALNRALLEADNETERIKIIKDVLTNLQSKRIDLLVASVGEKEKKTRTNTYIAAGAFILVGIGIIAYIVKKS